MNEYRNENEIAEIVRSFEKAAISRTDWKHREHLTVALYYLSVHDYETAYRKMRDGIFKLLRAFEIDFAKEMPYHETLTVFWLKTVDDFRRKSNGFSNVELYNRLIEQFDKNYPLQFYTRERLFSDEARAKFIVGDARQNAETAVSPNKQ